MSPSGRAKGKVPGALRDVPASTTQRPPRKAGPAVEAAPVQDTTTVRVVWGDLTRAPGAVLLVGHYAGVRPLRAEAALDAWVSNAAEGDETRLLITELSRRGVLRGELGELQFFPGPDGRLGAVAGMGQPGTFAAPQARRLARTVAQTVGLLPWHATLTTVVIGSGEGNLPIEQAAREFLMALVEALDADPLLSLHELVFVEHSLDRALRVVQALESAAPKLVLRPLRTRHIIIDPQLGECAGGRVPADFGCSMLLAALCGDDDHARDVRPKALDALPPELREDVSKWLRQRAAPESSPAQLRRAALRLRLLPDDEQSLASPVPVRITCTHDGVDLRMTAITASTTVPERVLLRKLALAQHAGEHARHAPVNDRAEKGRRLRRYLVHSDFRPLLEGLDPLVLELDAETAALPWEMLPAGDRGRPMALNRPMARQLRTRYSPRPFEVVRRGTWRALVIGDPASGAAALPSAQEEAQEVARLLIQQGLDCTLLLGAPEAGTGAGPVEGVAPADYAEVIDRLLSGDYDIVHFCGHAVHDAQRAGRSGWVFDDLQLLSGSDLEGAERAPRMVFANACASAQLQQPAGAGAGLLEGLADAFFQQGVRHYIGTAWSVPSQPARLLALEFYRTLFGTERCSVGDALLAARQVVHADESAAAAAADHADDSEGAGTATWAAYQHYGDPTERFDRAPQQTTPPAPLSAPPPARAEARAPRPTTTPRPPARRKSPTRRSPAS